MIIQDRYYYCYGVLRSHTHALLHTGFVDWLAAIHRVHLRRLIGNRFSKISLNDFIIIEHILGHLLLRFFCQRV
jgi:hypothetical protein